jgi:predicted LPLAT superfamily acyltransferase
MSGRRPEAGGRFAIRLIRDSARAFGRGFVRTWLYPITLYFYLRRGPERRASAAFLARVSGRRAGPLAVMRHLHRFSSVVLDRVFLLTRGLAPFRTRVFGFAELSRQIDRGRGVLLLSAHLGSFEALSVLKQERPEVLLKVVMDHGQTADYNALLYQLNPELSSQVIEVGTDPGEFALQLQALAQQGGIIGLLADRLRDNEPAVPVRFIGGEAWLPGAPYLLASMLRVPVVLGFGLYRGGNRYDLHFETLADDIVIDRTQRAAQLRIWAQRFADRLEHYARQAPDNWFNFYDFWHRGAGSVAGGAGSPVDAATELPPSRTA